MSDILIRGMEMPKTCEHCPIYDSDYGICNILSTYYRDGGEGRLDDCPLVELPEHGDLIDRSELKTNMIDDTFGSAARYVNLVQILDAPVIVPASEEVVNDPKT